MDDSRGILELAKQNQGIVTTSMVVSAGYSRGSLKYLADKGKLEKASRGVYTLPDTWEDEFVSVQSQYKRGVFSLGTALFLSGLSDRTPIAFHMTFPATYNLSGPKAEGILCSGSKEPYYSMGQTSYRTPGGNLVQGYNKEKTLCDILRPCNHVDVQLITHAFKEYVKLRDKNLVLLSEYAKALKVEDRVRRYLEVLL